MRLPTAKALDCDWLLLLRALPNATPMLSPPAAPGWAATASSAFRAASAVVPAASALVRASPDWPCACPICAAVCIADTRGFDNDIVRPLCRKCVS